MEKGESRVKFARRRTALDELVGMIDAMIALDIVENKELCLPMTGSCYLQIDLDCTNQTIHNDFKVW